MSLKLYFHPLSSFCQKVLVALYENDTPFEPHIVDLMDDTSRAEFKKVWPIGKFPVLQDDAADQDNPGVEHHHRVPGAAPPGQDAARAPGRRPRAADADARSLL